ncbi:MAG: LysR family transcriptional regulator [Hyphomicrobiales bacterium]
MKLDPIQTFVEVVRAKGFSAAAKRTGIPLSTISLQVKSLEKTLGTRLLKRSTRSIALTDEGQKLFQQTSEALDVLTQAIDDVRSEPGTLRGLIRLTAAADFPTELLAKAVTEFSRKHPKVHFQITLTNTKLDLVSDNIDIAVRIGVNTAMDAVEKRLLDVEWGFYASTEWIEGNGRPETIEAISSFISPAPALRTYLERVVLGGTPLPKASIQVDSHFMARDLMLCGFGISLLPTGLCVEPVKKGHVEALLTQTIRSSTRLNLTFPTRADMLPRVREFAEYLSDLFKNA